ncbi:MAG: PRC-barrel domain containing protein [Thiobacillus sp.]
MKQLRKLRDLKGYSLLAPDGEIGRIEQIYFDDRQWIVRYFVVHTGSWLLGRDVLIAPQLLKGVDAENKRIAVALSREQVENCPPISSERPVSRHYEMEYRRHYGLPIYWEASAYSMPATPAPVPLSTEPIAKPENPHLRDSAEVMGYPIQARDGELGHIVDFVLDEDTWDIRYLVVDTGHWWPGKKVLVAPAWITGVDWALQAINVDLAQEAIRTAPPYDPDHAVRHDDEVHLFAHYRTPMQAADASETAGQDAA